MTGRPLVVEWKHTEGELREAWDGCEAKDSRRFQALWLLRQGKSLVEVAGVVGRREGTVGRWVRLYRRGGLEALVKKKTGPPAGVSRKLSAEQVEELMAQARAGQLVSAPAACAQAKERWGVRMSDSGMRRLFRRLGLRPKRPRPFHPKRDQPAQDAWKKRGS